MAADRPEARRGEHRLSNNYVCEFRGLAQFFGAGVCIFPPGW